MSNIFGNQTPTNQSLAFRQDILNTANDMYNTPTPTNTREMSVWDKMRSYFTPSGGTGYYGAYTDATGETIGVDKAAYDAMKGYDLDGGSLAMTGGLGDYATYTDANGQVTGINKAAYDAMQNTDLGGGSLALGGANQPWYSGMSTGDVAQLGGLALQTYNSLFGPQKDLAKAQVNALRQQSEANAYNIAKTKKGDTDMRKGLAAAFA